MTAGPDFIDNRDGNTLARALTAAIGDPPDEIRIATAYFTPAGFSRIADALEHVAKIRLLLGADPAAGDDEERKRRRESDAAFARRRIGAGLGRMESALRRARDRLPFTRSSGAALRRLAEVLGSGRMQVRRYEKGFLHAKAYIFTPEDGAAPGRPGGAIEGVIAGSSNLTAAGLTGNLELNLARYDRPVVERARAWFDDLWAEAEDYDLAIVFEDVLRPHTPWEIFIRVLWQLYGAEVMEDAKEDARTDDNLSLTNFQQHGVARALRLIHETGGAIVADEVGLGKTFIAGEILRHYRKNRQRALLICPAALRDSTWKSFLTRFELFVECLSFEELARERQLGDGQGSRADRVKLQRELEEYQLVVVDEAHNYRNPDAPDRAGVLRKLLFGQRRDLLLLTATPVNNSLWDLFHLIRFFVRQDAHFADRGIRSIHELFKRAMREDPSALNPDILYPIIDATTVKRTRQFVKKHYGGDRIAGPDGGSIQIEFPTVKAITLRYDLEDLLPGFFDRLEAALDPEGEDAIQFARYMPDAYRRDGGDRGEETGEDGEEDAEEDDRARRTVGLLRSGLLKRFESSAHAFRRTVAKMVDKHSTFLDALDSGVVVTTAFMREPSADDEAVFEEVLSGTAHRRDAGEYQVERLRAAVERDRATLQDLAEQADSIAGTPARDPKLLALAEALSQIARQAKDEAGGRGDEAQKRKVLVFSFFADTVEYIRDFLTDEIARRPDLACYRDRLAAVSGSARLAGEVSVQQAAEGFAPLSMEVPSGSKADRYDLLVATDVLAEGVNLQQCRHIVNFDVPWNPMRLVQRHGRIDRIASPHKRVFMRTIFPVDRLDRLLNLEQRIRDKLAMAAASVGVAAPVANAAQGSQVFTETRTEIENLLAEDPALYERGGTVSATQSGEEYRQTLRKALAEERERARIATLPWKIGSGMVKGGARRGVFFCAVVGRRTVDERPFLRFVPADEDWAVQTGEGAILRETATCLRLIECKKETPTWYPDFLAERVYDFWQAARDDILAEWMHQTEPANLQPRVRRLNRQVAAFIRENPPSGMAEECVERALNIVESPWPRREENMLRGWFEVTEPGGPALARTLVERILDTGLEPVESPAPLDEIEAEDIEVLCWMGIEAKGAGIRE